MSRTIRKYDPYDNVRKPTTKSGFAFKTKKDYKRSNHRDEDIEEGLQEFYEEKNK